MPVSLNTWQVLGLILASAMLWMHYVQLKDRHQPEPRKRLLIAFALGTAACGLSVLGFILVEAIGVPDLKMGDRIWTAVFCFLIIGPLEEGTKVLLAYLFIFRCREFDEPMDGFVYAATISVGFASMENFYNTPELQWQYQLARTVALPITHVLFSAIWGFGIGYALFCLPRSPPPHALADRQHRAGHVRTWPVRLPPLRLSGDVPDEWPGAGALGLRHLASTRVCETTEHAPAGSGAGRTSTPLNQSQKLTSVTATR